LEWVAEHVGDIAGSEVPIVVAGDSAGGNLSAVTAQRARDRGGPAVALQGLVYPVTDADVDNASYRRDENQLMVTRDGMIWFWDHYAPDEAQRKETDASPLQAEDLSGLPPAVVILAEYDVLRDEGQAYADRLQQAGVPVEVHVHPGQMHGFFTLLMLPGHDEAIDQLNASLDTHLGAATTS
jgi:acetyl esterase